MSANIKDHTAVGAVKNNLEPLASDDYVFYSAFETIYDDQIEVVSLHLDDLLPDESGAVVLFAAEGNQIYLEAGELLVSCGVANSHVTASGVDVTGLNVYNFASGLTLYSEGEVTIQTGM
ncbi:hypothetical protein WH96_13160 [Kiloniella spongiae]|uniref:Uncharacterized protein n=1 Tax=Kiloniella spongiae TaxID=1489064 RepID=A0A0H2MTW8_9PROT|nr:hypothetical protein [Kiloniella spongiae]KLN60135.1 hypothetical protein WH96_13160 [Kiloniella spongiae]